MNPTHAHQDSPRGALALGRGWVWPVVMVTALLALSYLPGHGVRDGLDLLASTVTALGLLAVSVAVPRGVRGLILHDRGPLVLFGATRTSLDWPDRPVIRRLLAIGASVSVSALAVWASALLAASLPVERSAHAVSLVVLSVNAWLLLSNLVPAPPLGGWSLLLALLDAVGTPPHRRLARARRLGRIGVLALAILLAAWALAIGHAMLLLSATVLAWYGWIATAVAEVDDTVSHFLEGRRVGDLLRPVATQFDADDLVSEVTAQRSPNKVALVFSAAGLAGAIGPRQIAGLSRGMEALRCEQVMVPIRELSIVPASAPAADLLPQLGRHGFVVSWAGGRFGYVEEHDLLERMVIAADVRRRVAEDDSRAASGGR
jgi:hypothetical protein